MRWLAWAAGNGVRLVAFAVVGLITLACGALAALSFSGHAFDGGWAGQPPTTDPS
jgi:hypothetical protein